MALKDHRVFIISDCGCDESNRIHIFPSSSAMRLWLLCPLINRFQREKIVGERSSCFYSQYIFVTGKDIVDSCSESSLFNYISQITSCRTDWTWTEQDWMMFLTNLTEARMRRHRMARTFGWYSTNADSSRQHSPNRISSSSMMKCASDTKSHLENNKDLCYLMLESFSLSSNR